MPTQEASGPPQSRPLAPLGVTVIFIRDGERQVHVQLCVTNLSLAAASLRVAALDMASVDGVACAAAAREQAAQAEQEQHARA